MKQGSVFQRHLASCPRDDAGNIRPHRCRGPWGFNFDYDRAPGAPRRQMFKSGFPTKAAARAALREALASTSADVTTHNLTVREYLESWHEGKRQLKPTTAVAYRSYLDHYLIPRLGHLRLLDLRAHHLDRLYNDIEVGVRGRRLSPSTVRRVHATLRSALNTAVKRRLIPYNPAQHVELPPERPVRARPWDVEQCQQFLRHARHDRLATLYHLILVTGMRRGEVIGLRWEDVDLSGEYLRVAQQIVELRGQLTTSTPKTRRGTRAVPLDPGTVAMLKDHRRAQDVERQLWGDAWQEHGLVFTREDGRPLRPEYVTRHFQQLAGEPGLPRIRLHDLRHTNASLALSAGVQMKVVSERLGHSTTTITADLYTHVIPSVGRSAAAAIADVLRTDDGPASEADACEMPARASGDDATGGYGESSPQEETGGPPGARTLNPRIKSPLLCQLS